MIRTFMAATFKNQTQFAIGWGAKTLLVAGLVLTGAIYAGSDFLAHIALGLISVGAALIAFGGVMRWLQKRIYHKLIEPNDAYRRLATWTQFYRWWLWVDENGRDRDHV